MLVVISCKEENIECTVLRGFFPNSKDPSVVLYANDTPIDTVYLDKDKNFIFNLKIKKRVSCTILKRKENLSTYS